MKLDLNWDEISVLGVALATLHTQQKIALGRIDVPLNHDTVNYIEATESLMDKVEKAVGLPTGTFEQVRVSVFRERMRLQKIGGGG
jgi:hypothetical protein